jgi:hypothetical protein
MSRSRACKVIAMALVSALPACRSGRGPSAGGVPAPASPARVQQLVGQTRILRHRGDERKVTLKHADLARLAGGCDAAVDVRQAALEGGTLRLSLTHLGRPNVVSQRRTDRRRPCEPAVQSAVVVSQVGSEEALDAVLRTLLPTPEQYLRTWGTPFDREPGPAPSFGAADGPGTTGEERSLARKVTTWPVALLTVDADVPAGKRIGGRESEVEFVALVGADGRLHAPRVSTPLSDEHAKQVLRALSLWRYQPARSATEEIPARVTGKAVLRLY